MKDPQKRISLILCFKHATYQCTICSRVQGNPLQLSLQLAANQKINGSDLVKHMLAYLRYVERSELDETLVLKLNSFITLCYMRASQGDRSTHNAQWNGTQYGQVMVALLSLLIDTDIANTLKEYSQTSSMRLNRYLRLVFFHLDPANRQYIPEVILGCPNPTPDHIRLARLIIVKLDGTSWQCAGYLKFILLCKLINEQCTEDKDNITKAVLSAAIPSDLVEFLKERNEGLSDLCGDTRSKIGWILYEDADQKNLLAVLGSQRKRKRAKVGVKQRSKLTEAVSQLPAPIKNYEEDDIIETHLKDETDMGDWVKSSDSEGEEEEVEGGNPVEAVLVEEDHPVDAIIATDDHCKENVIKSNPQYETEMSDRVELPCTKEKEVNPVEVVLMEEDNPVVATIKEDYIGKEADRTDSSELSAEVVNEAQACEIIMHASPSKNGGSKSETVQSRRRATRSNPVRPSQVALAKQCETPAIIVSQSDASVNVIEQTQDSQPSSSLITQPREVYSSLPPWIVPRRSPSHSVLSSDSSISLLSVAPSALTWSSVQSADLWSCDEVSPGNNTLPRPSSSLASNTPENMSASSDLTNLGPEFNIIVSQDSSTVDNKAEPSLESSPKKRQLSIAEAFALKNSKPAKASKDAPDSKSVPAHSPKRALRSSSRTKAAKISVSEAIPEDDTEPTIVENQSDDSIIDQSYDETSSQESDLVRELHTLTLPRRDRKRASSVESNASRSSYSLRTRRSVQPVSEISAEAAEPKRSRRISTSSIQSNESTYSLRKRASASDKR